MRCMQIRPERWLIFIEITLGEIPQGCCAYNVRGIYYTYQNVNLKFIGIRRFYYC